MFIQVWKLLTRLYVYYSRTFRATQRKNNQDEFIITSGYIYHLACTQWKWSSIAGFLKCKLLFFFKRVPEQKIIIISTAEFSHAKGNISSDRSSDKINIDRLAYFNRTIIEWLKNKYTYFCSIFWLVKFYNHVKVYIVRFKNL